MRLSEVLNEAPAAPMSPITAAARPAAAANPTQAHVDAYNATGTHVNAAADKFGQGDNTGGVMSILKAANSAANAAGASFLDKMEMGWMAIKAGASAAIAGRKGDTNAAINAAVGSMAGEIADLSASYVNQPDFAQNFQKAMLAMKDSTDPDQQQMYKKYMSRQLTAESFKAYMNRFNAAIQDMKKNPATAKPNMDDTPYVTPEELPTGPNANPMNQDPAQQAQRAATNETAELNRILRLSGMEFIAEDATATQQFVGTGSSRDWSMSDNIATLNATKQMIKQKYGNRPPPGNGIELKYYNKQQKTIADPAKPGNYLTTVTFTPIESKLSPAISVKPSMDPNQDFDYFYNGQQVKPGDAFFDRIKQIHDSLGAGDVPAQPEAPANETTELSRLSKLISEGSTKSITVQRGDTLGRIARDNSTTVDAILKINTIANPDRIYPGDVIQIPTGQVDVPGGRTKRQGSTRLPDRAEKLTTTTSTGNPKIAMEFFLDQGWTPEQAAGLVANLQAESYDHIDPAAFNAKEQAYGIAQWRGPRKRDFEREMGRPIKGSSLDDQLKFVQWELNNTEKRAGRRLKQATTAAEAAAIVDEFYERSAGIHRQERIASANSLLTAFA